MSASTASACEPEFFVGYSESFPGVAVQTQVPGASTVEMDTIVDVTTLIIVSVTTLPTVFVITDTGGAGLVGSATVIVSVVACPSLSSPTVTVTTVGVGVGVTVIVLVTALITSLVSDPSPTVTVITDTAVETSGVGKGGMETGTVMVLVIALVSDPSPTVTVMTDVICETSVVEEGLTEAGTVIVLITALVSEPSPTVTVITDSVAVADEAGMVTVLITSLASDPSPVVIVMTDTIGVLVSIASTELATEVSAGIEELNEARTDEEMAGTSVTGHTVVVTPMTVVTITVETPSGKEVGSEVTGPVDPELIGQLVTVGAHEIIVWIEVADTVIVVSSCPGKVAEASPRGGIVELVSSVLVTVALLSRVGVIAGDEALANVNCLGSLGS